MDNIQSWSSFEKQQKQHPIGARESADDDISSEGADALYVSPSSSNIAQSAASLLRQAGLSGENDDDFKLKFHWMRPHPSLIFEIEDELMQHDKNSDGNEEDDADMHHGVKLKSTSGSLHPAIEASRLMKAHRYAQVENDNLDETKKNIADDTSSKQSQNQTNQIAAGKTPPLDLPIELPKLRINLASLVEPPLMSSWLPGEDLDEEKERR